MKHIRLIAAAVLCTAFFYSSNSQSAEQMKAWQEFMEPGAMHKMMAIWDGAWNLDITHWMEPGGEGSKSTATCVSKTIMGGRYSESKYDGNFFGAPFEGVSLLAYDNGKKEFVSTWIDNMGTGVMILTGTYDAATKTLNLKGSSTDPMTGKDMAIRETVQIVDDNTQVMEMYNVVEGKELKTMSITMKRKK